jgi:hypothetical protein
LFCQCRRQSGIDTPLNTTLVSAVFSCLTGTVDGVAGLGEEDRMNGIIPKTASSNEVAAGERAGRA